MQRLLACVSRSPRWLLAKLPASTPAVLVGASALIGACSEPLVAVVGVEGDARVERSDRDDTPDDGHDVDDEQADAASGLGDAEQDDPDEPGSCLLLPDLVQAGVLGENSGSDVLTTVYSINFGQKCPVEDDAGVGPSYVFERLDGKPFVRAGRRYALRWPPEGKSVSLLALMGPLSGASKPCEPEERLANVNRTVNGSGCVEMMPDEDAPLLLLETPVLVGLGITEFELCPGACSP